MEHLSNAVRLERNGFIRSFLSRFKSILPEEFGHAARVAVYSVATGQRLGIEEHELLSIRYSAELHDIGKLEITAFTASRAIDQSAKFDHPGRGAVMMSGVGWLQASLAGIRSHHERWDGSGYPAALIGEQIPLGARIISVAEAFDSMTMPCGWNVPIGETKALEELRSQSGLQFDPEVVKAFLTVQPIIQPVGL